MKRRTLLHDILGPGGLSILFQPIFEISGGQGNPLGAWHDAVHQIEAQTQ